ncbi:hypothetical protein Landi51_07050 [Colletotrichum acutatum]
MAKPTAMAVDALPRFLLPRLSWTGPATGSHAMRPVSALPPSSRRRMHTRTSAFHESNIPSRCRSNGLKTEGASILASSGLTRSFHATPSRQRDHHFDTLKFVQRMKSEGFTEVQAEATMKVLNDVIQERTMVLREDAAKATYTQKVDFAKLRSELLSADSTESSTTRASHEKLGNDIAKLSSRLRDEIGRTQASVRLDLNLEKGRIREEAVGQELKIKETETKIEQEVAALREKLEQVKFQTLQWLMGVCTGFAALLLGAWRLLM